jgi:hypothetical protein
MEEDKIPATTATDPANAAPIETVPPSGRDAIILFVEENMPELKEATDEEKYNAALLTLEKNKVFHEKMTELFKGEPMLGTLISAVMTGEKSFLQAMAETISPEEYAELLKNESNDVVKAREERLKKLSAMEEQGSALDARSQESVNITEAWLAKKKDWNDEKKKDFLDKIIAFLTAVSDGVITENELDQLENAFYFDEKFTAAREEGIITGRNEQINDARLKKEVEEAGDGLPAIASGGGDIPETPPNTGYFDDVFNSEGGRRERLKAGRT